MSVNIVWRSNEVRLQAELTPDEMLLLDGKVGAAVQEQIDLIKAARRLQDENDITFSEALFVMRTVRVAKEQGRLTSAPTTMQRCAATGQTGDEVIPAKATRKNPDRRPFIKPVAGRDLNRGYVIMEGRPQLGISHEALERLKPVLAAALDGVEAEVLEAITGHPPRFKRYRIQRCEKCGHQASEQAFKKQKYCETRCPECTNSNSFKFRLMTGEFVIEAVAEGG